MLFSIIVPFYNAKEYLEKCIESVINQGFFSYELILVDDGSTDDSSMVCDKFLTNERVKYYRKENGGVSSARNFGLSVSNGEYVIFLDSDDYLENNSLYSYSKIIESDFDFVCSSFHIVTNKTVFEQKYFTKVYDKKEISKSLYDLMFVITATVGKLFKSEIIKTNQIMFDDRFSYSEDTLFNLTYLKYCERLLVSDIVTYNVRRSNNSHSLSTKCYENIYKVYDYQFDLFVSILQNHGADEITIKSQSVKYANKISQTCIYYYLCRLLKTRKLVNNIRSINLWIKNKVLSFVFFADDRLFFSKKMIDLLNKNCIYRFVFLWKLKHFPFVLKKTALSLFKRIS